MRAELDCSEEDLGAEVEALEGGGDGDGVGVCEES